jgi:cytoskeleton-associated protein 5
MLFIADVRTATKNKVPLVRSLTLNWVTFCTETSNKAVVLKVHKDYVPIFMEVSAFGLICVMLFKL